MGLRTGSTYSFGERGEDYVLPNDVIRCHSCAIRGGRAAAGSGGGDTCVVNVTVQGTAIEQQDLTREIYNGLIRMQRGGARLVLDRSGLTTPTSTTGFVALVLPSDDALQVGGG